MSERSRGESAEARASVVLGALVADAAAMGLHWLYDPERLADIAKTKEPLFLDADAGNFEGAKGYFAHGGKRSGELSQYGATLALAMDSLAATDGRLDVKDYQRRYLTYFGPGGAWKGYIDRPTRGTLANLGLQVSDETPEVSGIDAAIIAAGPDSASLEDDVLKMIRVTTDNPLASEAAMIVTRVASACLRGDNLAETLDREADSAGDELKPLLGQALTSGDQSSIDIAGQFGRACHVQQGLPVAFHIASTADSYEQAIRTNVLAGGDTCGRSMALGTILGARFGFGGERGIPLPWLTRLDGGARLFDKAYQLAAF